MDLLQKYIRFFNPLQWLVISVLVFISTVSHAVQLGELSLYSGMHEPLRAEIRLLDVKSDEDIEKISLDLANRQAFAQAGVDRSFFLTNLNFEIERSGSNVLAKITTDKPVKESYLAFLLEVRSPAGRDIREYTALFDLDYKQQGLAPNTSPDTVKIKTAAQKPLANSAAVNDSVSDDADEMSIELDTPNRASATLEKAAQTANAEKATDQVFVPNTRTIKNGESIWSIARTLRPSPEITLSQIALALRANNPDAFLDSPVWSTPKAGSVLRVPSKATMAYMSAVEAKAEVKRLAGKDVIFFANGDVSLRDPSLLGVSADTKPAIAPQRNQPASDSRQRTNPGLELNWWQWLILPLLLLALLLFLFRNVLTALFKKIMGISTEPKALDDQFQHTGFEDELSPPRIIKAAKPVASESVIEDFMVTDFVAADLKAQKSRSNDIEIPDEFNTTNDLDISADLAASFITANEYVFAEEIDIDEVEDYDDIALNELVIESPSSSMLEGAVSLPLDDAISTSVDEVRTISATSDAASSGLDVELDENSFSGDGIDLNLDDAVLNLDALNAKGEQVEPVLIQELETKDLSLNDEDMSLSLDEIGETTVFNEVDEHGSTEGDADAPESDRLANAVDQAPDMAAQAADEEHLLTPDPAADVSNAGESDIKLDQHADIEEPMLESDNESDLVDNDVDEDISAPAAEKLIMVETNQSLMAEKSATLDEDIVLDLDEDRDEISEQPTELLTTAESEVHIPVEEDGVTLESEPAVDTDAQAVIQAANDDAEDIKEETVQDNDDAIQDTPDTFEEVADALIFEESLVDTQRAPQAQDLENVSTHEELPVEIVETMTDEQRANQSAFIKMDFDGFQLDEAILGAASDRRKEYAQIAAMPVSKVANLDFDLDVEVDSFPRPSLKKTERAVQLEYTRVDEEPVNEVFQINADTIDIVKRERDAFALSDNKDDPVKLKVVAASNNAIPSPAPIEDVLTAKEAIVETQAQAVAHQAELETQSTANDADTLVHSAVSEVPAPIDAAEHAAVENIAVTPSQLSQNATKSGSVDEGETDLHIDAPQSAEQISEDLPDVALSADFDDELSALSAIDDILDENLNSPMHSEEAVGSFDTLADEADAHAMSVTPAEQQASLPDEQVDVQDDDASLALGDIEDEQLLNAAVSTDAQEAFESEEEQLSLKVDLARMYINLGDIESAKEILSELVHSGNPQHQNIAKKLLLQLSD